MISRIVSFIIPVFVLMSLSCSRETEQDKSGSSDRIRVVSLSPSISRQILDLGAGELIAGVTTYHDFIENPVPVVGTIVNPNLEKILRLKPDYVFLSEEDATVQRADRIIDSGLNVVKFPANRNFRTISDNYLKLASLLEREKTGLKKIQNYEHLLWNLTSGDERGEAVAFFVSLDPLIPVSGRSYLGDIIRMSGARNIFEELKLPYPVISYEQLYKKDPEVIVVAVDNPDRGFFIKNFSSLQCVKNENVYFVDTDPFAYYSPSDFVRSVNILRSLLDNI